MQNSAIDSLEASFQSIELTINRMCGLFGRPEGNTLDPVSSPPLAQDDEDGKAVRHHPLFPPEEDRLASLARRARSHAERLEGCCQELQEKYEQVAAIEQKLERSSVIWKVAVQKLTELLATQKAQLTLLKASHIKKSSASTSLSPPPSLSASVMTAAATTATTKGSQKSVRKLRRRDSDTLYERRNVSSSATLDIDDYENETDDSNLRNALEIMWKVERAKKEAHETAHQQALPPLNFDNTGVDSGNALIKSNNNSGGSNNSGGEDGSGGISGEDDIEQVSATILGNIVVLDEVMSEMAAYGAVSRKGKSKKRGGGETMIIDSGEIRKPVVMVDASVQTDPLAPEQLRSLLDSMVLTPNQDQGCNIQ